MKKITYILIATLVAMMLLVVPACNEYSPYTGDVLPNPTPQSEIYVALEGEFRLSFTIEYEDMSQRYLSSIVRAEEPNENGIHDEIGIRYYDSATISFYDDGFVRAFSYRTYWCKQINQYIQIQEARSVGSVFGPIYFAYWREVVDEDIIEIYIWMTDGETGEPVPVVLRRYNICKESKGLYRVDFSFFSGVNRRTTYSYTGTHVSEWGQFRQFTFYSMVQVEMTYSAYLRFNQYGLGTIHLYVDGIDWSKRVAPTFWSPVPNDEIYVKDSVYPYITNNPHGLSRRAIYYQRLQVQYQISGVQGPAFDHIYWVKPYLRIKHSTNPELNINAGQFRFDLTDDGMYVDSRFNFASAFRSVMRFHGVADTPNRPHYGGPALPNIYLVSPLFFERVVR